MNDGVRKFGLFWFFWNGRKQGTDIEGYLNVINSRPDTTRYWVLPSLKQTANGRYAIVDGLRKWIKGIYVPEQSKNFLCWAYTKDGTSSDEIKEAHVYEDRDQFIEITEEELVAILNAEIVNPLELYDLRKLQPAPSENPVS